VALKLIYVCGHESFTYKLTYINIMQSVEKTEQLKASLDEAIVKNEDVKEDMKIQPM
jgi:hypothetical protein